MIVACWKVINEVQWLKLSMDSVYPYVDKLVIVEGCDSFMRQAVRDEVTASSRVTEKGLSIDGTTELVENYHDPDGKVTHVKLGFIEGDESVLWNAYLKECSVGDWCWSIDGDEVYPKDQAEKVVELIKSGQYEVIKVNLHNLWKECDQRIVGGGWYTKHERVAKVVEEGMFYLVLSDIKCSDGTDLSRKGRVFSDDDLHLVHFSYVRDKQKMLEKMCWQLRMYEKWDTHPKWAHHREMYKGDPAKYLQRNHVWFTEYYEEGIKVVDYVLPDSIRDLLEVKNGTQRIRRDS